MTNASSSKMSIEDMIGHYQRSIERSQHDPNRVRIPCLHIELVVIVLDETKRIFYDVFVGIIRSMPPQQRQQT